MMNEETLVAVYDTAAHADDAVRDLLAAHVPADAISQHAKNTTTGEAPPAREQGFWSSLFGGEPDYDTSVYDRSIEGGSTVVTVKVPAEYYDRVSALLEKHDPIDMDERAAQYGAKTTTTRTTQAPIGQAATGQAATGQAATGQAATGQAATGTAMGTTGAATDGGTMKLAEETLSVGKRAVSGGTTRIRRHVVETPVEEQVTLRTENVTLDRRPVSGEGQTVGDHAFTDKTIEMTETSEEAVVSKTARVVEEVSLSKETTDRTETVKDTVRRDEVEIEKVPGGEANRRTAQTDRDTREPPTAPAAKI